MWPNNQGSFFAYVYLIIPVPLVEKISFSPWTVLAIFSKINCSCMCVSMSGFCTLFHRFVFTPTLHYLIIVAVSRVLKSGSESLLFFSSKLFLAILGPLHFYIDFRNSSSISTKQSSGIFIVIVLNLYINLERFSS